MKKNKQVYSTDWLGSSPIFYNEKTRKVSKNINDVIDYKNCKFHPEGLSNYLAWGYSVFGQTPIEYVKFLLPNQTLTISNDTISITDNPDPVDLWTPKRKSTSQVISVIKGKIKRWQERQRGDIIIPASGGYDSRFLCSLIHAESDVHAFTYGTSADQQSSYEVIYARDYTKELGLDWHQIVLGDYHRYTPTWLSLYGPSTHAHGMYQMEFFDKIPMKGSVLSGIIGDAWTGKVAIPPINKPSELHLLGYSHGLYADANSVLLKHGSELQTAYFTKIKHKLHEPNYRIVTAMRQKMILLSYLLRVPEFYGFDVYGPFLDYEVVMSLLDLDLVEKADRQWQTDYFRQNSLLSEERKYVVNHNNNLDQHIMNRYPLRKLDEHLLSQVIDKRYTRWVNQNISVSLMNSVKATAYNTRYIGYLSRKLGVHNTQMEAYAAYLTLLPLEWILRRKEGYEI